MRRLSESDFTSKKQKGFSKKAKRFDRTVVRHSIADINCNLDDDGSVVKSVSTKHVLSLSGSNTPLIKSKRKKIEKKIGNVANWEITELSPAPQHLTERLAGFVESAACIGQKRKRKRKTPPVVKDSIGDKGVVTGKKEKSNRKKQKKHANSSKDTNHGKGASPREDFEGDTTIDSDNQQSAFEGALVTTEEVEKAAEALLKLIKVTGVKRGRSLFESEAESVHMQIISIRIPRTPTRRVRFSLPHPLVTETSDICLFVPDLLKGPRIDYEPTVALYRELLDKHGVKQITKIMPVRQLKDEYYQFEMRRRLCDSYDLFLAEGRICGPITPLLGKAFHVKRKLPTPVNVQSKNLKAAIEKALSKTALTVTPHGDSTLVKIGLTHHSPEQLTENIMSVIKELKARFPGGWHNIRSLSLKTGKSLRVPFYVTMKSANSVKVPVEKPRRPKAAVAVEDELSTIPGARVVVLPSGEIIVNKEPNSEDSASEVESEGEFDDEEENDDDEDPQSETKIEKTKKVTKDAIKPKTKVNSDKNNDDSDSGVEAAEDEYLSGWMQELKGSETPNDEVDEPAKKKPRHQNDSVKHKKKTKMGKTSNTAKSMKKTKKIHETKGSEKKKKPKKID